MHDKNEKMICPICGNGKPNGFSLEHENDLREDLWQCKECGHAAAKMVFRSSNKNPFVKESEGNFSDNRDKMPSNKENVTTCPGVQTRDKARKRRRKPESRLDHHLDPTQDENVRRVSMSNPFIKENKITENKRDNPFAKKANYGNDNDYVLDDSGIPQGRKSPTLPQRGQFKKNDKVTVKGENPVDNSLLLPSLMIDAILPDGRVLLNDGSKRKKIDLELVAKSNPFTKKARQFKKTKEQEERDEETNQIFPEGFQGDGKLEEGKGSGLNGSQQETVFDTVDRKERRNSDNPRDFVPGYKEWEDREVDHYYDGWVEDHVKNSGGSVPGSNTEKVMNLNEGERAHVPEFPTEAVYEALLEGRHELDGDLVKVVAEGRRFTIKKSDAESILGKKIAFRAPKDENEAAAFISWYNSKKNPEDTALDMSMVNIPFFRKKFEEWAKWNLPPETMECNESGIAPIATGDSEVVEARKTTKEEKEEDSDESEDKMQTTEQRLDGDEVNGGERVHKDYDGKTQKKRTNVHSKDEIRLEKEAIGNPFTKKSNKKKRISETQKDVENGG